MEVGQATFTPSIVEISSRGVYSGLALNEACIIMC